MSISGNQFTSDSQCISGNQRAVEVTIHADPAGCNRICEHSCNRGMPLVELNSEEAMYA